MVYLALFGLGHVLLGPGAERLQLLVRDARLLHDRDDRAADVVEDSRQLLGLPLRPVAIRPPRTNGTVRAAEVILRLGAVD